MDNDATKVLNEKQNEPTTNVKSEKKGTNILGQGMATAAGAAFGTGAAMATDHIYEHVATEAASEEEAPTEATSEEPVAEEEAVVEEVQATVQEQPQQTVVDQVETVQPEAATASVETAVPADAELVDDNNVVEAADTTEDNEVHVIGVAIQDNGQGGVATLAELQSGDDVAVVVDVESDGTIDIVGVDDNDNGQIEGDEWHPVEDVPFSTGEVVGAYVAEAHAQGAEAVVTNIDTGDQYQVVETESGFGLASMDDSVPDDNMYAASTDDMPDYMNDADAGLMDA